LEIRPLGVERRPTKVARGGALRGKPRGVRILAIMVGSSMAAMIWFRDRHSQNHSTLFKNPGENTYGRSLDREIRLGFWERIGNPWHRCSKVGCSTVHAVEIDPLANENARENAELNGVGGQVVFSETLSKPQRYSWVIANILKRGCSTIMVTLQKDTF